MIREQFENSLTAIHFFAFYRQEVNHDLHFVADACFSNAFLKEVSQMLQLL